MSKKRAKAGRVTTQIEIKGRTAFSQHLEAYSAWDEAEGKTCPTCFGTGLDRDEVWDCETCFGEGILIDPNVVVDNNYSP